jgi:LysM repeat protein
MIKSGDSLTQIARRFNTTVETIVDANVICNPGVIFEGQLLIVPEPNLELPLAGGSPYYIVKPGDTLYCLSQQFEAPIDVLVKNNSLRSPMNLHAWSEVLVIPEQPEALELKRSWESTPGRDCSITEAERHDIYYLGTFRWQALGRRALPFLIGFLDSRCDEVRYYAALALGRIGLNGPAMEALRKRTSDSSPMVASMAQLALTRIELVGEGYRRTHLLTTTERLYSDIGVGNPTFTDLPEGTPVTVLQWMIPSPTGMEGPKGGIQIYDYVEVLETGQKGFLARAGDAEIRLV